jgi:hypothetical protein
MSLRRGSISRHYGLAEVAEIAERARRRLEAAS